jgi:hypothetical protein
MCLRIGCLLAITGLTFVLLLSSAFVVVGGVLIVFGGIALALGMEPLLAEQDVEGERPPETAGTENTDLAA